jgi:hypothetical protein
VPGYDEDDDKDVEIVYSNNFTNNLTNIFTICDREIFKMPVTRKGRLWRFLIPMSFQYLYNV